MEICESYTQDDATLWNFLSVGWQLIHVRSAILTQLHTSYTFLIFQLCANLGCYGVCPLVCGDVQVIAKYSSKLLRFDQ